MFHDTKILPVLHLVGLAFGRILMKWFLGLRQPLIVVPPPGG